MLDATQATKNAIAATTPQALPPRPVAALRLRGEAQIVEALVAWPATIADESAVLLLLFADRCVRPAALTGLAARANAVVTYAAGDRDVLPVADARRVAMWVATHSLALDARPDQLTIGALGATAAQRTATAAVEHLRADGLPGVRGPLRFVLRGDSIIPSMRRPTTHPSQEKTPMRKLTAGLLMTLDGVTDNLEQWQSGCMDAEVGPALGASMSTADTLVPGRHTSRSAPAAGIRSHHRKGTDMHHVISTDGSRIAFDRRGSGQPVILVDGALCSRGLGPSADAAKALSGEFTVVNYDRRGRGESSDESAGRFEVEREIEDLAALVEHLGGRASLVGFSSGGGLAIEAAGRIPGIRRVVAYEVPYITDPAEGVPPDYAEHLRELVVADQRSAAVRYFLRVVGMPAPLIALMRLTPPFRKLKRVAHTLPYDAAIIVDALGPDRMLKPERWATVGARVTVLAGAKSPASMRRANAELAAVLGADHAELPGLNHMVKGRVVAPALAERLRAPSTHPA